MCAPVAAARFPAVDLQNNLDCSSLGFAGSTQVAVLYCCWRSRVVRLQCTGPERGLLVCDQQPSLFPYMDSGPCDVDGVQ